MPTKNERLKAARLKAGFSSAAEAARTFGWELPAYRHHENGTRSFDVETASRYGRAFRVGASWLLRIDKGVAEPLPVDDTRSVEVRSSVAAGLWLRSIEWDIDDRFYMLTTPSPFPKARRFGVRVDDFSMDLEFPPGTLLDCLSNEDIGIEPEVGELVIVERVRADGMTERTVKVYSRDDAGRVWFVVRSSKPDLQTPIAQDHGEQGDRARVIAFVIGSYQPSSSRLFSLSSEARKTASGPAIDRL